MIWRAQEADSGSNRDQRDKVKEYIRYPSIINQNE